jgi:molecular chaperone GrpE
VTDEPRSAQRVVIRDNRKVRVSDTGAHRKAEQATDPAPEPDGVATSAESPEQVEAAPEEVEAAEPAEVKAAAGETKIEGDALAEAIPGVRPEAPEEAAKAKAPPPLGAELAALRSALEERTKDLQRITAEYANYRKRVDRDRALVVEQATGNVLAVLLPVLDDLDRARDHGDLTGPFAAVAEQLTTALSKFGLTPFGAKGDPFDPTRHDAVAHSTSAEVTEPTCVDVMRRGYLLGERLLRPALVAVADPE